MEKDNELTLDDIFSEERKAEFFEWREKNADRIEEYKKISAGSVPFKMAIQDFQYDSLWKFATDIQNTLEDLLNFIEEEVPKEIDRQKLATILNHYDAIKAKQNWDLISKGGRKKGTESQRKKGEKTKRILTEAVENLFSTNETSAYWSKKEIAEYIHNIYLDDYTIGTIEQYLKDILPSLQKAAKSNL